MTGERANRAHLLTATTAENVAGFFAAGYFVTVSERLLTEPEQLGRKGQGERAGFVIKTISPAVTSQRTLMGRYSPGNLGCVDISGVLGSVAKSTPQLLSAALGLIKASD